MPTHYETLGIEENSSPREIKNAYRRLSLRYHPDKNSGNSEYFLKIKEAYDILSDISKKQKYDARLSNQREEEKRKSGLESKIVQTTPRIVKTKIKVVNFSLKVIYREIKVEKGKFGK
jgi:DnaJ-class molecular chaperone